MYSATEFHWPDDAHIAVVFNIAWETWPRTLATAESTQRANSRQMPATAKYTRGMRPIYEHAFAETGGLQRLLDVFARHDVRTSVYANGMTVGLYPDLAREIAAKGHELLGESWEHEYLFQLTVPEQAASIDRTVKTFEAVLGARPSGFSTPGGMPTAETFSLLAERGFTYVCGLRNAEVPFVIRLGSSKLVGMTSYTVSDYDSYASSEWTPRALIEMVKDDFDVLYDEGRRGFPKMLAYGSHPFLAHGFRTAPLEELISYVRDRPGVWVTTRAEVADWVLSQFPDLDLAGFYPEAAEPSDRYYGLSLGLGGEEAAAEARRYRVP